MRKVILLVMLVSFLLSMFLNLPNVKAQSTNYTFDAFYYVTSIWQAHITSVAPPESEGVSMTPYNQTEYSLISHIDQQYLGPNVISQSSNIMAHLYRYTLSSVPNQAIIFTTVVRMNHPDCQFQHYRFSVGAWNFTSNGESEYAFRDFWMYTPCTQFDTTIVATIPISHFTDVIQNKHINFYITMYSQDYYGGAFAVDYVSLEAITAPAPAPLGCQLIDTSGIPSTPAYWLFYKFLAWMANILLCNPFLIAILAIGMFYYNWWRGHH